MIRVRSIFVLMVVAAAAVAEDQHALARYLPPETPVYVETNSPSKQDLEQMAIFKMLEEPKLKALLERIAGDESSFTSMPIPLGPAGIVVNSDMSRPSFAVKVRYVDAKGERSFMMHNRLAFAWVGAVEAELPLDLVAAFEVDRDASEVLDTVRRIVGAAALAMRGEKDGDIDEEIARLFRNESHRGVAYTVADLKHFQVYLAPVGKLVVATTTEARVKDIIERHQGAERDSLAGEERYRAMLRDAVGKGGTTSVFVVHVDRGLDAIQQIQPDFAKKARQWLVQLGLHNLESITTVARADGPGVTSTTAVNIKGPRVGLGRLFDGGEPAKFGCLAFAPQDTIYVNCGNLDPAALFDMAVEVGGMEIAMAQPAFKKMFGLRLREDLLELLGPEAAIMIAPNRGLIPDIAVIFETTDEKRLEKSLLQMLGRVPWPSGTGVRSFKIGDHSVHAVPMAHPGFGGAPISPTFGVVDGHLLVTLYPISFQRFLAVKRGDRPGIDRNRDFAKLRERVPEDALSMSYLDLRRIFALVYDTALPFLQSMPRDGIHSPPLYEMPEVEVFTKHLYGRVAWRTADERGMKWYSHSSIDTTGMLLGGALGGFAALAMADRMHQKRLRVGGPNVTVIVHDHDPEPEGGDPIARQCGARVDLWATRLKLYKKEHGTLPNKLEDLDAAHVDKESFMVPGRKARYVYLGPKGKGKVLLHGLPNGKDNRICVLLTDMQIKRVSEAELKKLLEASDASGDR